MGWALSLDSVPSNRSVPIGSQLSDQSGFSSVSEQLLQHYVEQNWRVAASVLFGASILAALVFGHVPMAPLVTWGLVVVVLQLGHAVTISKLPSLDKYSASRRLQLIVAGNIITSLAHASIFPLFYTQLPLINVALLLCIFVSFWAGGLGLSMGFRPNYLSYVLPTAGVLLFCLALWSDVSPLLRIGMCVGLVGYVIYLAGVAQDVYKLFAEAVSRRQQVFSLNERLSGALTEAESANASKTRFLASASHDLRQPLHALSLFSAALSAKNLDTDSREIAVHLNTAVEALTSQMDALLDISKLDAGLLQTKVSIINLTVLLQRLKEEFTSQTSDKGLQLYCDIPTEAWAITDVILLERVLRNLLTNSLRYTEAGSLSISLNTYDGRHHITISDTGKGIPVEEHQRIFDEFYQLNNTERDRSKGLGLGLSIVQRICKLLNIPLTLESAEGKGTSMSLGLLVAPASTRSVDTRKVPDWAASPLTGCVLVVDDEVEVLAAMKSLLDSFGCEVLCAQTTDDAEELSLRKTPDLMLADFRLKGGDSGIDAIERVRGHYPGLKALLITGDTAPARLQEAVRAGLKMLHKPVPADKLHQTVSSELNANNAI